MLSLFSSATTSGLGGEHRTAKAAVSIAITPRNHARVLLRLMPSAPGADAGLDQGSAGSSSSLMSKPRADTWITPISGDSGPVVLFGMTDVTRATAGRGNVPAASGDFCGG